MPSKNILRAETHSSRIFPVQSLLKCIMQGMKLEILLFFGSITLSPLNMYDFTNTRGKHSFPWFRKCDSKRRTHRSDFCGFFPEINRRRTSSVYGVLKNKLVVRVSLRRCWNNMKNCRGRVSTTLVVLLLQLCSVCCDITDGNAEHLKREHSLMKPYQGKATPLAR